MLNYKKKRINHNHDKNQKLSLIKTILTLCLVFFIFSILFAILLSLFFYKTENPTTKIRLVAILSIYLSSFLCGIVLARINNERVFLNSLIFGTIIFLIVFILSLFVKNNQYSIYWHIFLPIISILGSLCGKKRNKSRKRRHKVH